VPHEESTGVDRDGTTSSQVALGVALSCVPIRPKSRQYTIPAGKSAAGCALVPDTSSVAIVLVHARSVHSSTCTLSFPPRSQCNVGRRVVARAVDSGAIGRAGISSHVVPESRYPALQTTPHVPASHRATPFGGGNGHGEHDDPHVAISASLAHSASHTWNPSSHANPHDVPSQVAAA
jgi:hypothetical protein